MTYEVTFTDIALASLKRYPRKDQDLILKNIEKLALNPLQKSNVKKLVNFDVAYRLRVGYYRILFERDDTLKIIDIVQRKAAYRRNKKC